MRTGPVDVVVLGAGHYVCGYSSALGEESTDKDFGVVLPSLIGLRGAGLVGKISIVGQSPEKATHISSRLSSLRFSSQFELDFQYFVNDELWNGFHSAVSAGGKLAAIIALPDHLHLDAIELCKANGIPFLIVKPALTNLSDYYQAIRDLPDHFVARVDYHKVFDPANRLIVEKVKSGSIGKIAHVQSVMTQKSLMTRIYRRWLDRPDGPNINHYLGSHYIHLTSILSEAVPVSVRAVTGAPKKRIRDRSDLSFVSCHVDWKAPDQEFSSTHLSGWVDPATSPSMTRQEIRIFGLSGSIESDQAFRGTWMVSEEGGFEIPNPHFFSLMPDISGSLNLSQNYGFESIKSFIDAIIQPNNEVEAPISILQSEKVTAVLEAADKSLAEDSRIVNILQAGRKLATD